MTKVMIAVNRQESRSDMMFMLVLCLVYAVSTWSAGQAEVHTFSFLFSQNCMLAAYCCMPAMCACAHVCTHACACVHARAHTHAYRRSTSSVEDVAAHARTCGRGSSKSFLASTRLTTRGSTSLHGSLLFCLRSIHVAHCGIAPWHFAWELNHHMTPHLHAVGRVACDKCNK